MGPLILIIILIIGGGASFAAEQAVPGNLLYPVKISINEKVRSAASFSGGTKAEWEGRLAERRLEEAEQLAAQLALSTEVRESIESNFSAHADRTQARIEEFNSREDFNATADIAANFETSLLAHERILARLAEKSEVRGEIEALLLKVRAEAEETGRIREAAETRVSADVRSETKAEALEAQQKSEKTLINMRGMLRRLGESASASVIARINAHLQLADQALLQGVARLEAGAYGEALVLFSRARQFAHQASILLEAEEDLNIENDLETEKEDETRIRTEVQTETETNGTSSESEGNVQIRITP